jgi:hypothetical protein
MTSGFFVPCAEDEPAVVQSGPLTDKKEKKRAPG